MVSKLITTGTANLGNRRYNVVVRHDKREATEVILVVDQKLYSAYKEDKDGKYSYGNNKAKELFSYVNIAIKGCTAKNGVAAPFVRGTVSKHVFKKRKANYEAQLFNGELAGLDVEGEDAQIFLEYTDKNIIPAEIPYIKLAVAKEFSESMIMDTGDIPVRSLEEIGLEKDITWLRNKKYYIVNDDETAEKVFQALENFRGPISYDTETTGLRINMFSKVNSKEQMMLEEYNSVREDKDKIRVDKLVGIIFCVEKDVSYYFPVANRKFKNLYSDLDSEIRKKTIDYIREQKMQDDPNCITDMGRLLRDTPDDELTSDVILMERVRRILEKKHLVCHNGSFEWKVSYCYDIAINLKDDTMLMHQVMYKFRTTTSNRGEQSNLKYLTKAELGIDQLDLNDFFVDYKEESTGEVKQSKKKKNNSTIDFSYMDYDGAKAYAPADGDFTLQIFYKYKRDMLDNHREQEYIYNVEVIVAMAIAYMEFYGHKIDESKIEKALSDSLQRMVEIEKEIRKLAGLSDDEELNIGSPTQVAKLFYDKLKIPFKGDKYSVDKRTIKQYLKMKNEDGTNQYPIVHLYKEWKGLSTLTTKFFDNLPNFMYPGGFIFSSYGQISTATGRMSCKKPNAQQYPDEIKKIIVPRKDFVMADADYSQIEYRTLVAQAKEERYLELFKDPDNDYHTLKASEMYDVPYASVTPSMRDDAKSFNFGIPYGMGLGSLAILLTGKNGPSQREEAGRKYELYFKDQPKVRKFFNEVKEMATVYKYTKTLFSRYRYYSFNDKSGNFSQSKKASVLRQAGNAVIQGTAADIFKIGVARTFMFIKENNLLGKLLITNMIHDEQLFEINCVELNVKRVLREIERCMSFELEGFPPLFIGAGFGMNWKEAKGKMHEIHPHLAEEIADESSKEGLFESYMSNPEEVVEYFNVRNYEFRKNKIIDYIVNEDNWNKDLHPAIGSILNLQFTYGLEEKYDGAQLTTAALREFIERENIGLDYTLFGDALNIKQGEEEVEYDDLDEEDLYSDDLDDYTFALLDEDMSMYEVPLQDIIAEFGLFISKEKRVCGIDSRRLSHKKKDRLADYLSSKTCEREDPDAMQIVFLKENNVLFNTGVYVRGIQGAIIESNLTGHSLLYA